LHGATPWERFSDNIAHEEVDAMAPALKGRHRAVAEKRSLSKRTSLAEFAPEQYQLSTLDR
jgi:hypothetical protein